MSLAAGMASWLVVGGGWDAGGISPKKTAFPVKALAAASARLRWKAPVADTRAQTHETTDPVARGIHQGQRDAHWRDGDPDPQAGPGGPRGRLQAHRPDRLARDPAPGRPRDRPGPRDDDPVRPRQDPHGRARPKRAQRLRHRQRGGRDERLGAADHGRLGPALREPDHRGRARGAGQGAGVLTSSMRRSRSPGATPRSSPCRTTG